MTFQKNVGLENRKAIQGDRANQNPTIYQAVNFFAGKDGVKVGSFVWRDSTDPETKVVNTASSVAPLGFIERTMNVNGFTYEPATMTVAEGENVTVAKKGDFYVEADGAVAIGDKVYASENGVPTFDNSGVETGYVAETTATESGDMVIISNW